MRNVVTRAEAIIVVRPYMWLTLLVVCLCLFQPLTAIAQVPGPIVSLPLDDGADTNAVDVSGNGNSGVLLNGPAWTTGRVNGGLSFDGANDQLVIGNSTTINTLTSGVTVAAWVSRTTNQGSWASVVSRQLGTSYWDHWWLGFSNTGRYRWFVNTPNGYSSTGLGGIAPLGQWVHVVGTYDGSFVRFYVNGVQQFSTAHTGSFPVDTTGIVVGASHNDAAHTPIEAFNGRLDEVRVYPRGLTPQEVIQLYQSSGGPVLDAPPTVSVVSPSPGSVVKGTIAAAATADDDIGVVGVQFMVDGSNAGAEDTTEPFSTQIDTTQFAEGQRAVSAVARDAAGNVVISAPTNVVFDNVAVMPLGDSLTAGFIGDGSPNNNDGGYRRYLWEELRADGIIDMNFVGSQQSGIPTIDRDHEGHGGFTINQLAASVGTWLPTFQPDIILLLIGTNDFSNAASTASQALTRLGNLLNQVHTLRPTAKILLATEPGVLSSNVYGIVPQAILDYNAGMPALVSSRASQGWDIALVDLYNLAGLNRSVGSPDYSSDGLHLSLTGYSKIANVWLATLNPATSSDVTPPSIPTAVSALATSSSTVQLSWNPSTDDLSGVAGYRVYRNAMLVATTTAVTFNDSGLVGNTTYSYVVTAFDWANNESGLSEPAFATTGQPPPVDTTPPSVPTGLTATATSATSIGLSWTGSTDSGSGASVSDTFNRANGGLGSAWTAGSGTFQIVSQHVEPSPNALTLAQLASWAGGGDQTAEVTVTVTGLDSGGGPAVRVGNGGANLYLVDYNGRNDHTLYRRLNGTFVELGGWTDPAGPADVVRLEATGTTIRVLVNGVVKVTATNAEVSGGVPGMYAFAAPGQQVQLDTFAATAPGAGPVAGYRIYRNGTAVATTPMTTYGDTGLTPTTAYTYEVTAFDAASNESARSAPPAAATTGTVTVPSAVLALPFNDGVGTQATDVSGNGNHGTLRNGPLWTTGVAGGALQFDGINDAVEVGPSASIGALTSQVTVAAWVYRAVQQGSWASVVSRQQGTGFFDHWWLGFSNTGQFRWFVNTTSGYSSTALGSAAPVGQWVHVTGTYDGAMVRLYVNGVQQFATAHSGTLPSDTTGVFIGASSNDAAHTPIEPLNGLIDDVRIYGVALAATQVAHLYQTTQAPPVDTTPPTVPSGVTATATSATSIGLSWTGSTDPGSGATVSDTFNRANGGLGSAWTAGSGTFQIVSQHVEPGPDTLTVAQLASWPGNGDHSAEVAVTVTGLNSGGGPAVRVGSGGANLYLVDYNGRNDHTLYRRLNGTFVELGGWTTPASPGDVVRLEATGTTIRVLVNGVVKVTVTNAEVSGGVPGMYAFAAPAQQVQLDTFMAAAPGAAGAVAGYRIYRNGTAVATTPMTTYGDTGLTPTTAYTYEVTAFDAASNESARSAPPAAATTGTVTVPSAVLALPFNDGVGTQATDVSGNGNHGTLRNGPLWTTGVAGGALQFDGINDAVEVGPSASIGALTSQVTVAAWVYRAVQQGSWASVVSRQQGTGFFDHWWLGFSNTGQFRWFVNTTSGYSSTALGSAAPVGQWVHVTGTYDGAMVRLYVNGVQQFATAHSGTLPSDTTGVFIGASSNDAAHTPIEPLNGLIDDVRIYGVALAATQVAHLYQTTQAPPVDTTPPTVPSGVTATATSATSIGLSWTGSTDPGSGATVSDTFNRANGGLGSAWTAGSGTFQIVSQHVEPGPDTLTVAQLASWTGNGDHSAEVAVTVTGLNSGGGPAVRVGSGGANLYLVDYNGRNEHTLYRRLNGTFVELGGWTTPASPGDVVRLEATGTTIRVLVNGVVKVTVTNAEVSGGVPGMYAFAAPAQQVQLDTFMAAGAGAAGAVAGYRIYRNGTAVATTPMTTYGDTGLTPNTAYTYEVTAFDAAGNESARSAPPAAATTGTVTVPSAVLALPFNDGVGTTQATDVSGNGNHGTLRNGPLWTTGVAGSALQFDGSNDTVEVGPSASINTLTAQVTVAAWVYRAVQQGSWASAVSRQQGTTFWDHWWLGFSNTGQVSLVCEHHEWLFEYGTGERGAVGQWCM